MKHKCTNLIASCMVYLCTQSVYILLHEQARCIIFIFVSHLRTTVSLVEKELLSLPEHLSSPPVLVGFVLLDLLFYMYVLLIVVIPPLPEGGGGMLLYLCPSVRPSFRPSKIFFVVFCSVTVDGRNLIFGHKRHIGTPYRGKRF